MQDCASDNKIKENKYKILRMSLLLGSDENREETLNNFEDAAREIDAMNDAIYLKGLEDKFYDTLRTKETLGYIVLITSFDNFEINMEYFSFIKNFIIFYI